MPTWISIGVFFGISIIVASPFIVGGLGLAHTLKKKSNILWRH